MFKAARSDGAMEKLAPQAHARKRFRYRKVTPELFQLMKQLRNNELNYRQIGRICGLDPSSVQYHLDARQHSLTIARAKKRYRRLDARRRQERMHESMSYRRWMRNYLRERYHADPVFRAKVLRANMGGRFAEA